MSDDYVLLYSEPSARAGMSPWHVETVDRFNDTGPQALEWHPIFRGTQRQCIERLMVEKERMTEPEPAPVPSRPPRPVTGSNAPKGRMKFPERGRMRQNLRYQILERDHFRCQRCGHGAADGYKLHVDHIVPVSKGGKTEPANLQTLCEACNNSKSDD